MKFIDSGKYDCLVLPKQWFFQGNWQKTVMSLEKSGQNPMMEQKFGLSMPKNPPNNLKFDHIERVEFFLIFIGSIF